MGSCIDCGIDIRGSGRCPECRVEHQFDHPDDDWSGHEATEDGDPT